MAQIRIYADFNGLVNGPKTPGRTAVVLDTFGSLRDLANAGVVLREGLPLVAVDASDESEDLEGHGTAEYDPLNDWWVVEFDEEGVRYVLAADRTIVTEFKCVSCKTPLQDLIKSKGLRLGDTCPSCRTAIHAPMARP
jgi:DNA-directed RNA polymerase subunit RPC12/RpoP